MHHTGRISLSTLFATSLIHTTYGHMALLAMYGETNGLTGKGFGIKDGAPRDSSARDPAQLDSPFVRDFEIQDGTASACGRTLIQGKLDVPAAMEKAEDGGLPDVGSGGVIRIVAHQVNGDGAGPYNCGLDTEAKGQNFQNIPVSVNVPNGGKFTKPTDFTLEAKIPQGTKCTGGADGQTCIVRCLNTADAGPYGGCMAFTQKQGLFNDPAPAGSGPTQGFQLDRITENPVTRGGDLFSDARAKMDPKALTVQGANGNANAQTTARQATGAAGNTQAGKKSTRRDLANDLIMNAEFPTSFSPSANQREFSLRRRASQNNNPSANTNANTNTNNAATVNRAATGNNTTGGNVNKQATVNRASTGNGNGNVNGNQSGNSGNLRGHIDPKKPTEEGIAYEIATGPLGQADVPQNVRQTVSGKRRSISRRQATQSPPTQQKAPLTNSATNGAVPTTLTPPAPSKQAGAGSVTNPLSLTNQQIAQAEAEEKAQDDAEHAAKKPKARRY
ncbi:hypothetical protein DFH28DRAFT_1059121 [Melampsora americana]|nr:hypothetical protein DFH28DRAFT_1059121 [Melampsora americana]